MAELDLSEEPAVAATAGATPSVQTSPYDPARDRERVRGHLAKLLLLLLSVLAIGTVAALGAGAIDAAEMKDVLTGVFSPLLAVFGTITGFYFGHMQTGSGPAPPVLEQRNLPPG